MEIETIRIPKEEATAKLQEYRQALKKEHSEELASLSRLYAAAAKGKRILDFFATMRQAGAAILNDEGDPRIAIARIGWSTVQFIKDDWRTGHRSLFCDGAQRRWGKYSTKFDVVLPEGTFPLPWKKVRMPNGQEAVRDPVTTIVPMVPVQHRPAHPNVEDLPYYVLWEVDKWEPVAPKDPYLLRRVTPNLFVIEAKWQTTKLERAFVNGRIAAR